MATFIVTKPAEAGAALADALRAAGAQVLLLPAFEIEPAADKAAARAALAQLSGFDLALFVSPAAVRATQALLPAGHGWPVSTRIAAVGAGTAEVARALLALSPAVTLLVPSAEAAAGSAAGSADEAPGSEALWQVLRQVQPPPRRVLILRAEQGREWLGERLREMGADVHTLAIYRRATRPWTDYVSADALGAALRAEPTIVVTSSEAARVVRENIAALGLAGLPEPTLLTMHPRIAAALHDVGFANVRVLPVLDAKALMHGGR